MYHVYMGAVQGLSLKQIEEKIRDVLWDMQKAQW